MFLVHATTGNCAKLCFRDIVEGSVVVELRIYFAHRGTNFLVGI